MTSKSEQKTTTIVIEVCIDSVESALHAVRGGANRLELCGNLGLGGGTTPSLGLLKAVQKAVKPHDTPIMVMIRPRVGDFLYSDSEVEVMLEDIQIFSKHGAQGFVFGVLTREGRVDIERTKRLVDASFPAEVCFHRAFDMTRDAKESIEDIMKIGGITRVLTSGQGKSVSEALEVLALLLETTRSAQSEDLVVMPGSGINPGTVGTVLEQLIPLGLTELHLSAGGWMEGGMSFRREGMGMGVGGSGDWGIWQTNQTTVREVKTQIETVRSLRG